jgi:hypothetical protein
VLRVIDGVRYTRQPTSVARPVARPAKRLETAYLEAVAGFNSVDLAGRRISPGMGFRSTRT